MSSVPRLFPAVVVGGSSGSCSCGRIQLHCTILTTKDNLKIMKSTQKVKILYYFVAENSVGKHIFCGGWVGGPVEFIGRLSPLVFSSKEMCFCLYPARTPSALPHPEFGRLAGWWDGNQIGKGYLRWSRPAGFLGVPQSSRDTKLIEKMGMSIKLSGG